jgi:CBS domain-containing protein
MRVSDVMHKPAVTCRPSTTLGELARLMDGHDVGCVIVLDADGSVAGVVTDRDIAIRGIGAGRSSDATTRTVMSSDVASISPRADIGDAVGIMRFRGVRRLPVVDEHGAVHGVVALDDLVRVLSGEVEALGAIIGRQT